MDSIIQAICGNIEIGATDLVYLKVVIFCIILDTMLSMFSQLKGV